MKKRRSLSKQLFFGFLILSVIIFTYFINKERNMWTGEITNNIVDVVNSWNWLYDWAFFWWWIALFLTILWLIVSFCLWWWWAKEKLKKTDKFDDTIDRINNHFSDININLWVLTKQFDKLERVVEWMQWTLNILTTKSSKMPEPLIQSNSPISLTDAWKRIAEEEEMQKWIDNKWGEIKKFIKEHCKWLNPYDIQQFLLSVSMTNLEALIDEDWVNRLKLRAYNAWVPLELLANVVAVLVRDKYFKEEWINTEEIDECDPTKKD